jgi:vacuolar-type H+-ATPase subunit C/Vma6
MAHYLGDLNARARGLRTHLLSAGDLERLARSATLSSLQRELAAIGYAPSDTPATATSLDRAVRRHAAKQMAVLDRWCGDDRRSTFAVIFEDEDRRSIQAILRGAAQGTATEARMSGLIPTTSLPERALQALCAQPTPADVVRLLVLWSHPFGASLIGPSGGRHPSLFEMEIALQRAFARRAGTHARRGGAQLVDYVEQIVDLMNIWSALLHFTERHPTIADVAFVEGGRWLPRDLFETLMTLGTRRQVEARLGWELRKSGLAGMFRDEIEDVADLEALALRAQIDWLKRTMRVDPSGPASVIGFAMELRAEVRNLRGIVWGIALQAPAVLIQAELVVA